MPARHAQGSVGRSLVVCAMLTLAPSIAQAQDDAKVDTGWDIRAIDLGASLADPAAIDEVAISDVLVEAGAQGQPERSPDGTRLAYVSSNAASPDWPTVQVWVQDADGTRTRVTDHGAGAEAPTWSPDGGRIAFVSRSGGIYSITPEGDDQRTLVDAEDATAPDWSPDGRHVVFVSGGGDGGEIWTVDVRSGKLRRLTHSERSLKRCQRPGPPDPALWAHRPVCQYLSQDPAWSPDGRWIAFLRHEDMPGGHLELEDTDLWLMRADGSDKHRAVAGEDEPIEFPGMHSPDGHFQGAPSWSPDGRLIALPGGHCHCILIVDVATGKPRQLRGGLFERIDGAIDWGADGRMVVASAGPASSVWVVE